MPNAKIRRKKIILNPSRPNPGQREKIKLNFYFHTLCGASKGFIKALRRTGRVNTGKVKKRN